MVFCWGFVGIYAGIYVGIYATWASMMLCWGFTIDAHRNPAKRHRCPLRTIDAHLPDFIDAHRNPIKHHRCPINEWY
jgi:hypothetical protein